MKNTTTTLLMAALMAASGFAVAQTAPATPPGNLTKEVKPGTTSNTTRAEVKAMEPGKTSGSLTPEVKPGTGSENTRAEVKASTAGAAANPPGNLTEKSPTAKPTAGSAQRKVARDERRAKNKADREMKMKKAMPAAEAPTNK